MFDKNEILRHLYSALAVLRPSLQKSASCTRCWKLCNDVVRSDGSRISFAHRGDLHKEIGYQRPSITDRRPFASPHPSVSQGRATPFGKPTGVFFYKFWHILFTNIQNASNTSHYLFQIFSKNLTRIKIYVSLLLVFGGRCSRKVWSVCVSTAWSLRPIMLLKQ